MDLHSFLLLPFFWLLASLVCIVVVIIHSLHTFVSQIEVIPSEFVSALHCALLFPLVLLHSIVSCHDKIDNDDRVGASFYRIVENRGNENSL